MFQLLPHLRGILAGGAAAQGFAPIPGLGHLPFYNALSNGTLVSQTGPALSLTRATATTGTDHEGLVRTLLSGEARFHKLRRVENLVATTSEDFSNAAWTKTNGTITAGVADPLGGTSAYTFTASGGAGLLRQDPFAALPDGTVFRNSVWLRRRTGTGVVQVYTGGDTSEATAVTSVLTTSWQRFAANTGTKAGAGTNRIGIRLATDGDAVDVWRYQSENVTGQASTAPGEYVSKGVASSPYHGAGVDGVKYFSTANGNTVASNVVTEATGASLTLTAAGLWVHGVHTNVVLQSEDFGTTWVPVGTPTRSAAAKRVGAVVLDLIGDDDITAVEGQSQNLVFTGNAVKAFSVYVSQGTATDSLFRIRDTTVPATRLDGVLSWSAGLPSLAMTTGTFEGYDTLANGVFRLRFTTTSITAANTNSLQIYPAANNVTDVTDTGNIYVGGVMAENAASVSPYVKTTTAAVTVNADVVTADGTGVINQTEGTLYVKAIGPIPAGAVRVLFSISDGTTSERVQLSKDTNDKANLIITDGGVTQVNLPSVASWTIGASGKVAARYRLNDSNQTFDGTAATADTACTMPTTTTITLGRGGGGDDANTVIAEVAYSTVGASDANLALATT